MSSPYSNNILFKPILFILLSSQLFSVGTEISGYVFQDLPVRNTGSTLELNIYGLQENNELGVADINVTAYPEKISTLTDSNGSWSLATTKNSRIEFSNIPSYLKESPNSSSIKFSRIGETNINLALHNPKDYVSTINPKYVNNLQQNGSHIGSDFQALQTIGYSEKGLNAYYKEYASNIQGEGVIPLDTIRMEDIGSVWGKAYQKNKKRLFVASMLQRHIGFSNSPADIYVIDYNSNPATLLGNFSLEDRQPNNLGPTIQLGTVHRSGNHHYTLRDNPLYSNIDLDAYSKVGKISYGGIDIDYHSNTLWLINLHQKALISVDISGDLNSFSTANVNQYHINSLQNVPTCNNGQLRPWAIKIHEGKGYIGTVCDASSSKAKDDLSANIISFDLIHPENGFKNELNIDLNYTKEDGGWHAWEDTYVELHRTFTGTIFAEPILSDIEFDQHNNMYISFMDRYATQLGAYSPKAKLNVAYSDLEKAYSHGEILKICNNNGIYEKEGMGTCSNSKTAYNPEYFNDNGGGSAIDSESALGSLALLKGSDQLLFTTGDPHPEGLIGKKYWTTQGVETLDTKDGSIKNWYAHAMTEGNGLNSKANGIGDIELISDPAPLEIGDRIWADKNSNGIQDANETGIEGVIITLICNGLEVNATTDSVGNYIFSNDQNGHTTSNHIYGISELTENENNCLLKIPNIKGTLKQSVLSRFELTIQSQGEGINSNQNDSDAILNGNDAEINIIATNIPILGANNHSFDIGFKPLAPTPTSTPSPTPTSTPSPTPTSTPLPTPIITPSPTPTPITGTVLIGNQVWIENDNDGDARTGNITFLNGLTVIATATDGTQYQGETNSSGHYLITVPKNDTYIVSVQLPDKYIPTANSEDNYISDINSENNLSHDANGTTVIITTNNNLSIDFGFRTTAVLGITTCQEVIINDDIQNANKNNATTTIDVIQNDVENNVNQQVKLLSAEEGEKFWRDEAHNITSINTFDTLVIEGEGTWSVVNNQIRFTALNSFEGEVPSPIYYILEGENCTEETKYSNVARVTINTVCYCPDYKTDSVSTLNTYSLLILIFLTFGISYSILKKEIL